MAQTKVKLISDGVIVQGNLHASHGITTAHIGEGSNLYYTDARVGSYLSSNGYATQSTIVAAITDSAPSTLDTLNELAAALGDDVNFSTTVTNSIATKMPLAGGTLTGNVVISNSSGDTLTLTKSTTEPSLRIEGDTNKDFVITVSGELLTFTQNDGTTDILTLDHDTKNATFAGDVIQSGTSKSLKYWRRLWADANNDWGLNNNAGTGVISVSGMGTPSTSTTTFAGTVSATNVGVNGFITHNGDSGTFMGWSADDTNVFYTAGNERLRIDSSGNIGIGEDNPQENLHITATTPVFRLEGGSHSYQQYVSGTSFYIRDVTNSSNRIVLDSSGNVGIGTTTINTTLNLYSSSNTQIGFQDASTGTGSADGFRVGYNGTYGQMWLFENAAMRFATNNTERMRINSSGNVGIGTTSIPNPFSGAYSSVLQVGTTSGNTRIAITSASNGSCDLAFADSNTATDAGSTVGAISYKHATNSMLFATNGLERMRIGSDGYIGMGITNTSNQRLTLAEADSNGSHIKMNNSRSGGGYFIMGVGDTNSNSSIVPAGGLFFYNGTTRMVINSSGNVGIGTTNPSRNLTIGNGSGNSVLAIVAATNGLSQIGLGDSDDDNYGQIILRHSDGLLQIQNGGGGGISERGLNITSSENVGIGMTSPSQKLEVTGNFKLNGTLVQEGTGNNLTYKYRTANSNAYTGGNATCKFGRFYWTPAHWVTGAPVIKVTLHCKYYQGERREYIIKVGYQDADPIINELQPSSTQQKITLLVGATTSAGYNYAGQPVYYVDLQWVQTAYIWGWAQIESQVGFLTSNPTSGWGGVVMDSGITQTNNSGTPTNYTSFFAGNLQVGGGIYLGGTAAANALDDYEEGTWTPQVYYQNSTDQANATNVVQEGKYTKIGNLVYVSFRLDFSQSGTPVNDNIGVKNLPFAGANNHYGAGGNLVTTTSVVGLNFQLPTAGSTQAVIVDSANGGNYGNEFGSGSGKFIRGSFTYMAQ